MLQNTFESKIRETEKEYAARIELLSFLGYSQYVSISIAGLQPFY